MKNISFVFLSLVMIGCANMADAPRNIIGFSTRDIEDARSRSVYRSYACTVEECYSAVLSMAEKHNYYVFMKDESRNLIVLMNIPGYVDTTEVGVFLVPVKDGVRVELSSRSSPAKRSVAQVLLPELAQKFSAFSQ